MQLYKAGWKDSRGAGGSCVPMPFADARYWLVKELERNIPDGWGRNWDECFPEREGIYEEVLESIRNANSFVRIVCGWHEFYIIPIPNPASKNDVVLGA